MSDPRIAPAARIQRDTRAQRALLPHADAHLRSLSDGFHGRASLEISQRLSRLADALLRSPAHRRRLEALGISPRDLRSVDDLRHFPTLSRTELAASWNEFPALDEDPRELFIAKSSGTTGDPVQIVRDGYDNLHMWTVLRFWLERLQLALPRRPRVVLLDALPGGLEYSVRVPLLGDGALHRISTSRADAMERVLRVSPSVIFSDPSGIHWLLGQATLPTPLLVLSSAQALSTELRQRFAERSTSPLLDYYATTETGPLAWACPRSPAQFHVLEPDVHIESIDGALAVTRLRESVLPLVRYLPGDRGEVVRDHCPCGFAGSSILGLSGRQECFWIRPDGSRVDAWSVAWLFKHHALRAFELTQISSQDFSLELETDAIDPQLLARLEAALRALGWTEPKIDAIAVEEISGPSKPAPFRCSLR